MDYREALREAKKRYEEAMETIPGFNIDLSRRDAEKILGKLSPQLLRIAFLFEGASHSTVGGTSRYPKVFWRIAQEEVNNPDLFNIAFYGYMDDKYYRHLNSIPLNRSHKMKLLLRIIRESPDDSPPAYLDAAEDVLEIIKSSEEIEQFRNVWRTLSAERREAIAIALHRYELRDLLGHGKERSVVVIHGMPSRLELLTRNTDFPVHFCERLRWIDREVPLVRQDVWRAITDACRKFQGESQFLGGEQEQVGALLQSIIVAVRNEAAKSRPASQGFFHLQRYVFHLKEEALWGPDFALLFLYRQSGVIEVARFTLFQAKRIKDGSIETPMEQMRTLIRSSWHSSFYLALGDGMTPHTVHAPLLENLVMESRAGQPLPSRPTTRWSAIQPFADTIADLIGDRILAGELGDPLLVEADAKESLLVRHLARLFGPPKNGVMAIRVEVGPDFADARSLQVAAKDYVIGAHGDHHD